MPQKRWQGRGAGAASGVSKHALQVKKTKERKKRKVVKAQKEVAKRNKRHRGGGAWILLYSDSDSCQAQSSEGESAASDPPRCDSFESDLVDAVNDDAREEHDLSCPDGDGAEVEEHGADGHGRTAGGVQAPHGVGSAACCPGQPVWIGGDAPHAQYVRAAKLAFKGTTCPPRLHCSPKYGLNAAAFVMPDWNEDTKAIQWGRLHVVGVCKVSGGSVSQDGLYVYFCSCNKAGQDAWNMCELFCFHNAPVGNATDVSANCLHVQALPVLLGHDPKVCIDTDATQDLEGYSHGHDDDDDDSLLAQWPCFALGQVYRFKTTQPRALMQVGVFGSWSCSNVGLVLGGRCRTCSGHQHCVHTRVWNLHNGDVQDDDGPDEPDGENHPPVNVAHSFSMTQDKFDAVFARRCNADGSGLKVLGWSQQPIPFDPAKYSPHLKGVKYRRCCEGKVYSESEGLRDPYVLGVQIQNTTGRAADDEQRDEHLDAGQDVPQENLYSCAQEYRESTPSTPTFLLHPAGVIPYVRVYDAVIGGQVQLFDGAHVGILRINQTVFLTHELLQEYWDASLRNRMTHRGWILSKINNWTRSMSAEFDDPHHEKNRQLVLEFLRRPSLPDLIFDALYDYIELLDVPYDKLIGCHCEQNDDFVICIYDNACKWLEYLLLRFPALHQAVHACIDALHAKGHKRCSPAYNHKLSNWTKDINAELNEQKNHKIKALASCFPFMSQIHAMVKLRYHIAMINLDQMASNRFLSPPTYPTLVFDGTVVGLNRRLFCPQRPYETAHDHDNQPKPKDLPMGCAMKDRLMIPDHHHRQLLHSLVEASQRKDRWVCADSKLCDGFVHWIRDSRRALTPFISMEHTSSGQTVHWSLQQTPTLTLILPLLLHWSSTAPETVVIPAPLIPVVDRILAAQNGLATEDLLAVSHCSQILFNLFKFCNQPHPTGHSQEHGDNDQDPPVMSMVPSLRALLIEMITRCKLCFKSQSGPSKTKGWPRQHDHPPVSAFEDMVRTGSYYPHNPVIRTLSTFKHDHLNQMARQKYSEQNQAARAQALQELQALSALRGVQCNKKKDHHSKRVTPGLFTAFCCGCSMCVGFDLMDNVESPKTLFLVVALRAWTSKQKKAHETWLRDGHWEDPDVHVPSYLRIENAVSGPNDADMMSPGTCGGAAASVSGHGRPMQTRRASQSSVQNLQCQLFETEVLGRLWTQSDVAMAFRPNWTEEQQQAFKQHCHQQLRQEAPRDSLHADPVFHALSRPKESSQGNVWSSIDPLSIPHALRRLPTLSHNQLRIEHNFAPALLPNVLQTLPAAIRTLQTLEPSPVWDMLQSVVENMRSTSADADAEQVTIQLIVTPPCDQGLNQVATTHFDHVHVLSVVLEGEKTWQMLPNQAIDADLIDSAEPNQAPACVPGSHALGASDNWSQVVLGPGQALFVPALMWHRVVSGPQGSVSINLLREPDNVK